MKNLYALVFILFVFCQLTGVRVSAQTSLGINYQAVARDGSGNPIASQTITVDFVIHRGASAGPSSWNESFSPVTNPFGLFNLVIGSTSPANFDTIGWGKTSYWLEVFVNTFPMGTTKFQSVPYAMHAGSAGNGLPPGTNGQTLRHDGTKWIGTNSIFNNGSYVGIGTGTITPTARLHIAGSLIQDAGIDLENTASAKKFRLNTDASGNFSIVDVGIGGRMTISPSGNVGIGTTTPVNYKLEVSNTAATNGAASFTLSNASNGSYALYATSLGSGPAGVFQVNNAGSAAPALYALTNGTGRAGQFEITLVSNPNPALYVTTAGTGPAGEFIGKLKTTTFQMTGGAANNFVLTSDGSGNATWQAPGGSSLWTDGGTVIYPTTIGDFVGVGAVPAVQFHVSGTVESESRIRITNTTAGKDFDLFTSNAGDFHLREGLAGPVRFSVLGSNGNMGVGTISPGVRLEVSSPGTASSFRIRDAAGVWIEMSRNTILQRGATSDFNIQSADNDIVFATDAALTERIRIQDGTGFVGIGIVPTEKLDVAGKTKTTNFQMTNGATAAGLVLTTLDAAGNAAWQTPSGALSGGSANYIPKWSSPTSLTNSQIQDNGTNLNISGDNTDALYKLTIGKNASSIEKVLAFTNTNNIDGAGTSIGFRSLFISTLWDQARISGVTTTGTTQGALVFETMKNRAGPTMIEAMRLTGDGFAGIGTTAPTAVLHVVNPTAANSSATIDHYGQLGAINLRRINGTVALPTAIANNDIIGGVHFSGYNGSGFATNASQIWVRATEAWGATNNGTKMEFQTTATGTNVNTTQMTIDQNGNIGIGTTASPAAKLEVNGDVAMRSIQVPMAGAINIGTSSVVELTGGLVAITSINSTNNVDGKILILYHRTDAAGGGALTTGGNIITGNGGAMNSNISAGFGATLVWNAAAARWIVISFNP